jgi:hypothetical protein
MSLYNLLMGATPATFFVLPMLGKHPEEYPRFRDCFTGDETRPEYDDHIHIYTRTGGVNREEYERENDEIRSMPGFVTDFDDSFDSTYASWVFKVPERWQTDFAKIKTQSLREVSAEYQAELRRVYPKLSDKFDELFNPDKSDQNGL